MEKALLPSILCALALAYGEVPPGNLQGLQLTFDSKGEVRQYTFPEGNTGYLLGGCPEDSETYTRLTYTPAADGSPTATLATEPGDGASTCYRMVFTDGTSGTATRTVESKNGGRGETTGITFKITPMQGPVPAEADAPDAGELLNEGIDYAYGRNGREKDETMALRLYLQAASLGNAEAAYRSARMYRYGIGTKEDKQKARAFYTQAAQAGHPKAAAELKKYTVK